MALPTSVSMAKAVALAVTLAVAVAVEVVALAVAILYGHFILTTVDIGSDQMYISFFLLFSLLLSSI